MAPRKRGVERIGSLESILKAAHGLTVLRSLRTNPAGLVETFAPFVRVHLRRDRRAC